MFARETEIRKRVGKSTGLFRRNCHGVHEYSSDSESERSENEVLSRSRTGSTTREHEFETESIKQPDSDDDSEELIKVHIEESNIDYEEEDSEEEDEEYSEEATQLAEPSSAQVNAASSSNNVGTIYIGPTQEESLNHSDVVVPGYQWDLLKNYTISRDQTKASDFKKEQLVALYDRKIEDRALQESENEENWLDESALENFDFDSFLHVGNMPSPPAASSSILPPAPPPRPSPPTSSTSANFPISDIFPATYHSEEYRDKSGATSSKRKYPDDADEASSNHVGTRTKTTKAQRVDEGNNSDGKFEAKHEIEGCSKDGISISRSQMVTGVPHLLTPTHPPGSVQPIFPSQQGGGSTNESVLVDRLQKRISDLENEIKQKQNAVRKRPRIRVFHVVEQHNPSTTCLQEPTWTFDRYNMLGLKAEAPLINPEEYLQRNDDIVIAVYRRYNAPEKDRKHIAKHLGSDTLPAPKPYSESIRLVSTEMREAVKQFLRARGVLEREFPTFSFNDYIPAPYLFWYRSRHSLQTLSLLEPAHQLLMKCLIHWIESNYKTKYNEFEDKLSRGRVSREFMDFVFSPGDLVVSKDRGQLRAYLTTEALPIRESIYWGARSHIKDPFDFSQSEAGSGEKSTRNPWQWSVPCWSISYDGDFYKTATTLTLELDAETHEDEVDIKDLNVLPLRFADEKTESQLRQRGNTFWSCRVKRFVAYQANDEDTLNNDGGRYMVDFTSYKALHLDKQGSKKAAARRDNERILTSNMNSERPPSAPEIYLFPSTITGFSLRRKRWTDLDVDRITNVSWNKDAFQHLVVDDKTKELVQALVANRIAREKNTDLIQDKGNGLIMLLHGGPGTGKTFTAESVAEIAEKPLYPVTCGDIGTEPEQVEKYLESVLHMGKIWDCVVLLDEADVFLEERSMADLTRNALVSVFLRVLEYYDGILILTSNRVGTFDEAFKSRIQLALHYPSLTKSQRCRIWKNFLNRLKALDEPDIDFDDIKCNITELSEEQLNGRQIRNAITTGRQLAKFQGKALSYQHLSHVITVSGQFETYLKNTKEGLTDEQVARASGIRF